MNEDQVKSTAQQAMSEIDSVLKKYNCELCYEEIKRNGQVAISRIMVIEKQSSLIQPSNGKEKILRMP